MEKFVSEYSHETLRLAMKQCDLDSENTVSSTEKHNGTDNLAFDCNSEKFESEASTSDSSPQVVHKANTEVNGVDNARLRYPGAKALHENGVDEIYERRETDFNPVSDKDEKGKDSKKAANIDRGWAWVILVAAFVNFLLCSTIFVTGIFNVKFLEEFQQSKSLTAWPSAIATGMGTMAGPIASIMIKKFGPKVTVCIGGLMACVSNVLTSFAGSIYHVIFTFGVMQGLGLCFIHFSSSMILGFYFKKYRNISFSIALSGIGVGVMVIPIIFGYLFEEYGTWGTVLITGAIQFHVLISGSLMRPIRRRNKPCCTKRSKCVKEDDDAAPSGPPPSTRRRLSSVVFDISTTTMSLFPNYKGKQSTSGENNQNSSPINSISLGVQNNIPNTLSEKLKQTSSRKTSLSRKFSKIIPRELLFPLFSYALALCMFGLTLSTIFVHLLAYAESRGVSDRYLSLLLSSLGLGSTFGRISIGFATHGSNTRPLLFYSISGFCSAILCFSAPYFIFSLPAYFSFAIFMAFFASMRLTLLVPIAIDLFGVEKLVTVTGILTFMDGVGRVSGAPLAGYFVDVYQTYYTIFPFTGVTSLLGSLLMVSIYVHKRCQNKQKADEVLDTQL